MQGQVHRGKDGVVYRVELKRVLLDGVSTDSEPGHSHRKVERQPLGIIGDHAYPPTILQCVIAGLEKLLHVRKVFEEILSQNLGDGSGRKGGHVLYCVRQNDPSILRM